MLSGLTGELDSLMRIFRSDVEYEPDESPWFSSVTMSYWFPADRLPRMEPAVLVCTRTMVERGDVLQLPAVHGFQWSVTVGCDGNAGARHPNPAFCWFVVVVPVTLAEPETVTTCVV